MVLRPQGTNRQVVPRTLEDYEARLRRLERRVATGGTGRATVSDTPPTTPPPVEGDLWFESDTGFLYVRIVHPSPAWVQV